MRVDERSAGIEKNCRKPDSSKRQARMTSGDSGRPTRLAGRKRFPMAPNEMETEASVAEAVKLDRPATFDARRQ